MGPPVGGHTLPQRVVLGGWLTPGNPESPDNLYFRYILTRARARGQPTRTFLVFHLRPVLATSRAICPSGALPGRGARDRARALQDYLTSEVTTYPKHSRCSV